MIILVTRALAEAVAVTLPPPMNLNTPQMVPVGLGFAPPGIYGE